MKVIVNADDLGMTQSINAAIFDLIKLGGVTSATVMANGAVLEDAASRARDFPGCSFGVHLNATEFRPLTQNASLCPILDESGCFILNRLREIKITRELADALFIEWCAQVECVQARGFQVSHFDSHHHVHTIPGVFFVLKRLQRHFRIRKVRLSMNIYPAFSPAPAGRLVAKAIWNFALRNYFQTTSTDRFTSLDYFIKSAQEISSRFRSVEIMVHPGGENHVDETNLLVGNWWRDLPCDIEFLNYNNL